MSNDETPEQQTKIASSPDDNPQLSLVDEALAAGSLWAQEMRETKKLASLLVRSSAGVAGLQWVGVLGREILEKLSRLEELKFHRDRMKQGRS